jgi:hypothetical protein
MEVRSLLQSTKGYHNEVLIASDDQKCNLQINQEKYLPQTYNRVMHLIYSLPRLILSFDINSET